MQHDEVIWQVIRHNHCSFMAKITAGIFCRNPYNLTGICNRSSCPLANSRYATIRDHDGVFYLYMKTIERAHMPNKLWERLKLPRNYEQALGIISKYLEHWPKFLQHKVKQRLTKMTQMRIRMGKLERKTREKIVPLPRKEIKRESRRGEKAEKAAVLEKSIENELLKRLSIGVYGDDIYNYHSEAFQNILDDQVIEEEEEPQTEFVEDVGDLEEEEEQDMEDFGFDLNTADAKVGLDEDDEDDDEQDTEVVVHRKRGRKESSFASKKADKAKKARVRVEVERDDADERQVAAH